MSRVPSVITVDFETQGFQKRPDYPPKPAGVSIQWPEDRKPIYLGWGHPMGNNCTESKARQALRDVARSKYDVLFHNAKFDYEVATTHLGMPALPWHRMHDTMYLLYLHNPHAWSLQLKPVAKELLGMAPEERDVVKDWILEHKRELEAEHGKFKPSEWGQMIWTAPGNVVGPYAQGDVTRTLRLFKYLYPLIARAGMLDAYNRERQLMPLLLANEQHGIRIDLRRLSRDIDEYQKELERADIWLRKRLKNKELNVDSDKDLAEALDREGIVTEWNVTKTGQRSVSKANLTPDMFNDKKVAQALGYRNRLSTCLGTFMQPWQAMAQRSGGLIYTNWNQVRNGDSGKGTRTGRLSSNPNFQNLPKNWSDKNDGYAHPAFLKVRELPIIRGYVLPDDRQSLFLHRDYNQQELRIAAHFEDGGLAQAFRDDPKLDVHTYVQEQIGAITGVLFERRAVKIINFGMLYGMGLKRLALAIGSEFKTAQQLRNAQQKALRDVIAMDRAIKDGAKHDNEPIHTWGGRVYYCEEPRIIDGHTQTWEYKLLNYLIQGSAADCTKQALLNYHELKRDGRFMLTVHDEINISAPKGAAAAEMKRLKEAMESVDFSVPMLSDGKMGKNWGELKKEKV